ncbi:MAG: toll/interleukin-1 receptor domain-containing protein [Aquabacterium sp.]|jgi:hypothetical protein|nr:MAG: toll/interleukin-1 receptor domain-containing protein [Aquabacterium sp.]
MSAHPAPAAQPRTDVFISYAREDRETARLLADALSAGGLKVWWDRDIPGGLDFAEVIAQQIAACRAALVLWSGAAVRSGFVRDESARTRDAGKLLPLRIAEVELPLGFGTLHTLDLIGWDGDAGAPDFLAVVAALEARLDGKDAAPAAAAEAALRQALDTRRWTRRAALVAGAALAGAAGVLGWQHLRARADGERAQDLFRDGVGDLEGGDARLQSAREAFLSAVRLQPGFGRAHFYLAQVYARMSVLSTNAEDIQAQRGAARAAYRQALDHFQDLDSVQQQQARRQLAALAQDGSTPVARPAADAKSAPGPVGAAPAPLAAPRGLPPDAATRQQALRRVEAAFGTEPTQRVSAVTGLMLDPATLSDAIPVALDLALRVQAAAPDAATTGTTLLNTLVLLQGASPATLRLNRAAIGQLLAALPAGSPAAGQAEQLHRLRQADAAAPVVYLQLASESQRALAAALAARLRALGYRVPAADLVGRRAPQQTTLRVQGNSSQALARACARILGQLAEAGVPVDTLRQARPRTDTYEIWLGQDLCGDEGPRPAACAN